MSDGTPAGAMILVGTKRNGTKISPLYGSEAAWHILRGIRDATSASEVRERVFALGELLELIDIPRIRQ